MVRVANRDCRQYLESLTEFKGSNLFSESKPKYYAVYSYGYHFPILLYVRAGATWFINNDKYSRSTSKHQSQAYPYYGKKVNTDKAELQKIINLLNRE